MEAAQLIDSATGDYLWSETYDRKLENVFLIQEEMARTIVQALHLKLTPEIRVDAHRRPPILACYNLCLQGRFHANKRTMLGLHKSVGRFEEAILADESCAEAHAGLADAYSLLADYGLMSPAEAVPKARAAAERALELTSRNLPEANVSLAFVRSQFEWRGGRKAEALYRMAIAASPGVFTGAALVRPGFSGAAGTLPGSTLRGDRGARSGPALDDHSRRIGLRSRDVPRHFPAALAVYREVTDMDPGFYKGYSSMGRLFSLMGKYDLAIAALERARELAGDVPSILSALGEVLARAGRRSEACALLEELKVLSQTRWIPASSFAILHLWD